MDSNGSYALTLAGIGAVQLLAAMSPGLAFLVITRISVGESRRVALAAAFGVANAALCWAIAATLGVHVLLAEAAWLYGILQLAGGAYLVWLGIEAWRHAGTALAPATSKTLSMSCWRAWRLGFSANLANPKVIAFYGSIFVALFAPEIPGWARVAALVIVAVNESWWFALVALLFSSPPAQAVYRRAKSWIDRATGAVMMIFGLRLILGARS